MEPRTVKTIAFLSFLFPFLIAVIQNYFNELSSIAHPNFMKLARANEWSLVGSLNNVKTYMKANEGSPLVTYRGVAILDSHISDVTAVILNSSSTAEWVPNINHWEVIHSDRPSKSSGDVYESTVGLYHALVSLPAPVKSRDFVIQRSVHYSPEYKNVVVNHTSAVANYEVFFNAVRGHLHYSNWLLQDMDEYCRGFTSSDKQSSDILRSNGSITSETTAAAAAAAVPVKAVVQGKCSMKWICKMNSLIRIISEWLLSFSEDNEEEAAAVDSRVGKRRRGAGASFKTSSEFSHLCKIRSSTGSVSSEGSSEIVMGRTLLVIDTLVDAGGSLPPWLVSYMHSMTWPLRTIVALRKELATRKKGSSSDPSEGKDPLRHW